MVSALNGQIAVDLATTQPFDLILMDMQMPVMDGYAATVELRRRGLTIPIIALTAYAMAEDRDKCLASGCNAYLSKPVDEETLLTAVNQYLGKRVPIDCVREIAGSPPPAGAASGSDRIRSSLAGDPRMMEIIPGFVDGLPGKVRKMLDLLEHHDLVALQKVVHELVGTAGGYGFATVSQPARKAQQLILAGADLEPIAAEINSLIEVIRRIEGYDESKDGEQRKVAVERFVDEGGFGGVALVIRGLCFGRRGFAVERGIYVAAAGEQKPRALADLEAGPWLLQDRMRTGGFHRSGIGLHL